MNLDPLAAAPAIALTLIVGGLYACIVCIWRYAYWINRVNELRWSGIKSCLANEHDWLHDDFVWKRTCQRCGKVERTGT